MKIIFNDLSELTIQTYSLEDKYISIKTINAKPNELRAMFEDEVKTRAIKIIDEYDELITQLDGFTEFYSVEEYAGGIYGITMYKPETLPATENKVLEAAVKVARIQAQELDEADAIEVKDIYPLWDGGGIAYAAGYKVLYGDILYKCLQAHNSQGDWSPEAAPSLWAKVLIPDPTVVPEWEQPDSTNPYSKGDKVTHNGKTWESLIDGNVWEPGAAGTSTLWAEV